MKELKQEKGCTGNIRRLKHKTTKNVIYKAVIRPAITYAQEIKKESYDSCIAEKAKTHYNL